MADATGFRPAPITFVAAFPRNRDAKSSRLHSRLETAADRPFVRLVENFSIFLIFRLFARRPSVTVRKYSNQERQSLEAGKQRHHPEPGHPHHQCLWSPSRWSLELLELIRRFDASYPPPGVLTRPAPPTGWSGVAASTWRTPGRTCGSHGRWTGPWNGWMPKVARTIPRNRGRRFHRRWWPGRQYPCQRSVPMPSACWRLANARGFVPIGNISSITAPIP